MLRIGFFCDIINDFLTQNIQWMNSKSKFIDECFPRVNCSQTVFSLHAEDLGLNKERALKIASGFGAGMSRGATCGAVTGAYMVIGLKYGGIGNDSEEKAVMGNRIKKFNQLFIEKHGALNCKNLLQYDISTPEGKEAANAAGVIAQICPKLMKTACDILAKEF